MWLSWELLALGTLANALLFKGQLPSLYRLLFFPFYAHHILLAITFLVSLFTTVHPPNTNNSPLVFVTVQENVEQ